MAGNLTRGQKPDGSWQRYEYDAAGRLSVVRNDATNALEYGNGYTSSRQRISSFSDAVPNLVTYYAWGGSAVLAEYATSLVNNQTTSTWQKAYIYAGSRLLSTYTKNSGGGETQEYHHPDRLGTKLVTNDAANTSFEQSTLPYGTSLPAETTGTTNQQFTSYDRSSVAQLDYAVNRSYSSGQSRFTSADPIGMGSTTLDKPQSLNMYAYVQNDPIDAIDSAGLDPEFIDTSYLHRVFGNRITDLPGFGTNWGSFAQLEMKKYEERVNNARYGNGFRTGEEISGSVIAIVNVGVDDDGVRDFRRNERIKENPLGFSRTGQVNQRGDTLRVPDYVTVNISVLTTGTAFTYDRCGNGYYTPFTFVPRFPVDGDAKGVAKIMKIGGNISFGWLNQHKTPQNDDLVKFLNGGALNISGGTSTFLGGGITYSPGNGTATELGLYTPGGGLSGSGSEMVIKGSNCEQK